MIVTCKVCRRTVNAYLRDGDYYCPECGCRALDGAPQEKVGKGECPICKNKEGNSFDGAKYHCALCDATFDLNQQSWKSLYQETCQKLRHEQYTLDLQKEARRWRNLGILFIFLFWPVSIYFFYRWYQTNKTLKMR